MSFKKYELPEVGVVTIYKRRGAKAIKLSISHDNKIRVTMPHWAPYKMGVEFVKVKASWIVSKQSPSNPLPPDSHIGKAHRLVFLNDTKRQKITSRIIGSEIRILMPADVQWESEDAQKAAVKACKRALKNQAERLLPKRLENLAELYNFNYRSISVKPMKSRWGSCSQQQDIVLNIYLMQLPWDLIDYVLLHELVHTRIMAHGEPFWQSLGQYVPQLTEVRRTMRQHRPVVLGHAY